MVINPLAHFSAPLKGETASDYWTRMIHNTPDGVKPFYAHNFADFRGLIAHINAHYSEFIATNPKTGRKLIECPPTQSGAVCIERHISRGGFKTAADSYTGFPVPMPKKVAQAFAAFDARTAAEPIQQPQPVDELLPEVHHSEYEYSQPVPQPAPQPIQQHDAAAALAAIAALMPKQGVDAAAVRAIVSEMLTQQPAPKGVDADAVREIVAEAIAAGGFYRGVEIVYPDKPTATIEGQFHSKFPDLLKALSMRQSVYLFGPAGTSKTTSAMKAAEALGLPFVLEVVGLTSTKTDFLGFVDAGGRCTETNFKRAFLNGGVYFIDEADSANANVGIALNTAIENGICAFPDGVFKAHPDFVAVAAGNTNGKGGTAQFGGRVRMDSAFQDRFAFMHWPIDEQFERAITTNTRWVEKVQKIRLAVAVLGLDEIAVTPRLSIKGEKMLAAGFSEAEVLEMLLFRGAVTEDVKQQILSRI